MQRVCGRVRTNPQPLQITVLTFTSPTQQDPGAALLLREELLFSVTALSFPSFQRCQQENKPQSHSIWDANVAQHHGLPVDYNA